MHMTPLTPEQLNAPLASEIIKPTQRFPSVTLFHNDAAQIWFNARGEDEDIPKGRETAAERRRRKAEERTRKNEERERRWREQREANERRQAAAPVAVARAEPAIRIAPARQAPVPAPAPAPARQEPAAVIPPARPWPLSDEARHDTFWRIIQDFGWHNRGEGPNPTKRVRDTIAAWPADYRATFMGYYKHYVDTMMESFKADLGDGVDMFQRNEIFDNEQGTVSHFVALGREIYNNMLVDHEYAQVLIVSGECEDFNVHCIGPR